MTKADRPWKWRFCSLQDDNVALLRCSLPRPWKLGRVYALRDGSALYVAMQPVSPDSAWPDSWVITDWCLANVRDRDAVAGDMLLDAIRRTLGYWDDRPAGGMVVYLPAKLGSFQTVAGLAAAGFEQHHDKTLVDGRVPWHLPASALPKPIRRRAAIQRAKTGAARVVRRGAF